MAPNAAAKTTFEGRLRIHRADIGVVVGGFPMAAYYANRSKAEEKGSLDFG